MFTNRTKALKRSVRTTMSLNTAMLSMLMGPFMMLIISLPSASAMFGMMMEEFDEDGDASSWIQATVNIGSSVRRVGRISAPLEDCDRKCFASHPRQKFKQQHVANSVSDRPVCVTRTSRRLRSCRLVGQGLFYHRLPAPFPLITLRVTSIAPLLRR